MLTTVAAVLYYFASPKHRIIPHRYLIAAVVIAGLALLNLIISGQPWGVVYGLGLWVAKMAVASGADLSGSVFSQLQPAWNACKKVFSLYCNLNALANSS
jgi:hypothetical protein